MANLPVNTETQRTDLRARAIVHYKINPSHWLYREITGNDVGCDCEFELAEDGQWAGHKIECQVKGTRRLDKYILKGGDMLSYPLEIKTINYGLRKSNAFLLLVVDVCNETIYYQCIHEYFRLHADYIPILAGNQTTLNIRIPLSNALSDSDETLQEYAKNTYVLDHLGMPRAVRVE